MTIRFPPVPPPVRCNPSSGPRLPTLARTPPASPAVSPIRSAARPSARHAGGGPLRRIGRRALHACCCPPASCWRCSPAPASGARPRPAAPVEAGISASVLVLGLLIAFAAAACRRRACPGRRLRALPRPCPPRRDGDATLLGYSPASHSRPAALHAAGLTLARAFPDSRGGRLALRLGGGESPAWASPCSAAEASAARPAAPVLGGGVRGDGALPAKTRRRLVEALHQPVRGRGDARERTGVGGSASTSSRYRIGSAPDRRTRPGPHRRRSRVAGRGRCRRPPRARGRAGCSSAGGCGPSPNMACRRRISGCGRGPPLGHPVAGAHCQVAARRAVEREADPGELGG